MESSIMRRIFLCGVVLLIQLVSADVRYLLAQEPLDGRNRVFRDELLENLVGEWKITRKIRGQTVESNARAEWTLNHQFLLVHLNDTNSPPTYEAMVFIGYD